LVGWDSPATQFRRFNPLETSLARLERTKAKPGVSTVP